jgi:hypothetical protein
MSVVGAAARAGGISKASNALLRAASHARAAWQFTWHNQDVVCCERRGSTARGLLLFEVDYAMSYVEVSTPQINKCQRTRGRAAAGV